MRIACIDDDPMFGAVVKRKMAARSVRVECFDTAQGFIDHERPTDFDLIMVDLDMADSAGQVWELAGVEVMQQIRRRADAPLPICVVTGLEYSRLVDTSIENGADGHVVKSQDLDAVCDSVLSVVTDFIEKQLTAAP